MQDELRDLSYQQFFYFSPWGSKHAAMTFDHHMPDLNVDAFKLAVCQLVERHEILRTIFVRVNDEVKQKVIPVASFKLEFIVHETAVSDSEMTQLLFSEKSKTFDIDTPNFFTVKIYRLRRGGYMVLFTMHHGLSDSYSAGVFKDELTQLYGAILSKRPSNLGRPPFQYSDFSRWQKDFVDSREGHVHREYWLKRLTGFNPEVQFNATGAFNASPEDIGRCFSITGTMEETLYKQLDRFQKKNRLSRAIVLMGAFTILINRLTSQQDISLFVPFSARESKYFGDLDCRSLIGCFVSALLVRHYIDKSRRILDYLREAQENFINDLSFASYPLSRLLHELPDQSVGSDFLDSIVYFNYHNYEYLREITYGKEEMESPGNKLVAIPGPGKLGMDIMEFKNCLRMTLRLSQTVFTEAQAVKTRDLYFSILKKIVNDQAIDVALAGEPA
jgi:hypothetical protein